MSNGFERYELDPRILDRLTDLGFERPTAVQHKVIPLFMQKKNLLVEAPTGSGKTAAYGFPLISRIDINKRKTQALVLVPSRELARQVESAFNRYSSRDMLRVGAVYGGGPIREAEETIARHPHILIAVPGRLRDALHDGKFPYFWRDVNFLVIDEADRLLETGFQNEVKGFLPHLKAGAQVSLFSATITDEIEDFARETFSPRKMLTVRLWPGEAWKRIHFHEVPVPEGKGAHVLVSLLRQEAVADALIFCNKREEVYSVSRFLRANGLKCEAYHGLMDQVEREAVMHRFRLRQVQFLVATDLAARGLDIENLSSVINFSLPDEAEVYYHRIGRTGRAGKKGDVYNLVASDMERIYLQTFHRQENIPIRPLEVKADEQVQEDAGQTRLQRVHLSRGKKDKLMKGDIVGCLTRDENIPAEEIGTIAIYDEHALVDLPKSYAEKLIAQGSLRMKGKLVKARKYSLDEEKARANKVKKLVISSKVRERLKKRK